MRIITGATGSAHVTSNDDGCFNQAVWGNESVVLKTGNKLEATILDNNTINIKDGDLLLQGRHARINPGLIESVTIQTGSSNTYRNDLIVARYTIDTVQGTGYESIELVAISGNETQGIPEDPTYHTGDIRTGATIVDFPLYRVKLAGINIQSIDKLFHTTGGLKEMKATKTATATANGWSGSAPYTQTISVNGMQDTDIPIISTGVPSQTTAAAYKAQDKAFGYINRAISGNGTLTLYCYAKKPTVNINLVIKGE